MSNKFKFLVKHSLFKKFKSKWFIASQILLAILIIAVSNADKIITSFGGDFENKNNIIVVDNTKEVYPLLENALQISSETTKDIFKYTIIQKDEVLTEDITKEDIVITIDEDEKNYLKFSVKSLKKIDGIIYQLLIASLNSVKTNYALLLSDIDQEKLALIYAPATTERIIINDEKSASENMDFIMSSVFPLLILPFFMLTIFLVQMIGAEINEEKNTRSMEIILSNVSAKTHLLSKIVAGNVFVIGQGALLFIYGLMGIGLRMLTGANSITSGMTDFVSSTINQLADSGILSKLIYILPLTLILMLITFLAYSLVAAILAAMTTNQEDFQQLQSPIIIVLLAGYYLSTMAGLFKGSVIIHILSYVPFISAILSPSLLIMGDITILDIVISLIIMLGTVYLLFRYGMKAYRVGILNYSSSNLWKRLFKSLRE